MPKIVLNTEAKKELINDIKENYFYNTPDFFAKKYNVKKEYIHTLACQLKTTQKYRRLFFEPLIVRDYINRKSSAKIQKEYKISYKNLCKILEKNNIPYRDPRESHIIFKHNENYFSKIDNEEKAYWLGFMYADGSVYQNKVQFRLKSSDGYHIEKFKKAIESEHKMFYYKNPKTKVESIGLIFRSPKMVDDLIKLGCVKRKSLIIKGPNEEQVPINLINHFIRGYFDGNGTIYFTINKKYGYVCWRAGFSSTLEMCTFLKKCLDEYVKNVKITVRKYDRLTSNTYEIFFGKIKLDSLYDFYNFLYKNATVFLNRKHNKFLEIFSYNGRITTL